MPENDTVKQNKSNSNRLYVDLPYATLRKLLLWAASRGESKNSWARTIIVLRCDENFPKVEQWLSQEASNLQVNTEELENSLLNRMGFDFEAYRKEMIGD